MALTQRLEMRQSQALVMTPQLMQAIKLLQLSNLDLAAYVEGELERNPLLERATEAGEPAISAEPGGDATAGGNQAEAGGDDRGRSWAGGRVETWRRAAARWKSGSAPISTTCFPDEASAPAPRGQRPSSQPAYSEWAATGSGGREDGDYNLEAFVSAEPTLADHLAEQLALAIVRSGRAA